MYDPITFEQALSLIEKDGMSCHYCNVETTLDHYRRERKQFTLERKFNGWGHSLSNVVIACWKCNSDRGAKFGYDEYYQAKLAQRNGDFKKINALLLQHISALVSKS